MNISGKKGLGFLVAGILLLLLGAAGLFYWSYLMLPRRQYFLFKKHRHGVADELWKVVQKDIQRTGGQHDAWMAMRYYGNKQWAARIIEMLKDGTPINGLGGPSHLDLVLRSITNQNAGDTAEAWIEWWKNNRDKSQVEWWLDGFKRADIPMEIPPSKDNIITLLRLLGAETHERQISRPNAFRWLRDNDFDEREFKVSDFPEDGADDILQGLIKYTMLKRYHPKGTGALNVGETVRDWPPSIPTFATWWFVATVRAALFLLFAAGAACLWLYVRKRKGTHDA